MIALENEKMDAEPLLLKVMENGIINYEFPSLDEVRHLAKQNLSRLPEVYKKLTNPPAYPVKLSKTLETLIADLTQKLSEANGKGN